MMKTVTLQRTAHLSNGTTGEMTLPSGAVLQTIEPPWADNKTGVSCIPAFTYTVNRDKTGRYQYYEVTNVPNRSAIEIHPANYFINPHGKQELHGCIAPGLSKMPGDLPGVASSRSACKKLLDEMGEDSFLLEVLSPPKK